MRLRLLKFTQLSVAIAMTLAVAAGLLWPGVMSLFVLPVFLLYVVWAARAARDHRFSVLLAFLFTVLIAVLLGRLAVSQVLHHAGPIATRAHSHYDINALGSVVDPTGVIVDLPLDAQTVQRLRKAQAQVSRRDRIELSILLFIAVGAWLVLVMYALEWRWAFTQRRVP